jgi:hypothetical protein
MKALFAVALLIASSAHAAGFGFRISEEHDAFTKASYLKASGLKLCQIRAAGFAAQCATLDLAWDRRDPGLVIVRLEQPGITSITEIAVNIDGNIQRYGADIPVTDFDYEPSLLRLSAYVAWSSANTFVLPVHALKAIAASKDNGVIRVLGTHAATDYDFYRKARAKGVPADELARFLEALNDS